MEFLFFNTLGLISASQPSTAVLRAEFAEKQAKLNNLKQQIDQLKNSIGPEYMELIPIKKKLDDIDNEISKLTPIEQGLGTTKQNLAAKQAALATKTQKLATSQIELTTINNKIITLSATRGQLDAEIIDTNNDISAALAVIDYDSRVFNNVIHNQQIKEKSDAIANLTADKTSLETELKNIASKIEAKKTEEATDQKTFDDATTTLNVTKKAIQDKTAEKNTLAALIDGQDDSFTHDGKTKAEIDWNRRKQQMRLHLLQPRPN
ncbi:hypothetical protein ECANGB1_1064 [Enterospora canceri]|uniref:Uncharacterized protein n=1 Tax=Enterospora canceri TaxID=1081671 RepID=A0A1Y1S7M0_9MICR|nr:hypothetical protein ECANGB1_1064 [Enterospora canceri]